MKFSRKVYVFATHGIFSGCARQILREDKFPNLEKVFTFNILILQVSVILEIYLL